MADYAMRETTVREAVSGGGLLVVAQWEAKEGQADKVADILARFLPEAQREEGAKLFLIGRARAARGRETIRCSQGLDRSHGLGAGS